MVANKDQIDKIHDQMPKFYKTRTNTNWKAVIEALGGADQDLATLLESVREQLFIKTASRPYIDRLGTNFNVSRPRFVGMDDPTFRTYIPVLAYQPKQVKLIIDSLLDIFFFRESTTAFQQSTLADPFLLRDGWVLQYTVDGIHDERIEFSTSDFSDITAATAVEVAGVINRAAENSFAIVFDDRITRRQFIRIFSNTVGSKGSIEVVAGRSNEAFRFVGFNKDAGSGVDTEWTVTKVGDEVTFTHTGGITPKLSSVQIGDVAIIELPGNEGSFTVDNVSVGDGSFQITNLFGTAGVFDHSLIADSFVRFMAIEKIVVWKNDSRAVAWEVKPGEIVVEMPATPPVVKRALVGSAHINGTISTAINRVDDTTLEIDDYDDWPEYGAQFILQTVDEIQQHILTPDLDIQSDVTINNRFNKKSAFTYTSRVDGVLSGITPDLPAAAALYEATISTVVRDALLNTTVTTTTPHGFNVGEGVKIQDVVAGTGFTTGVQIDVLLADSAAVVAAKTAALLTPILGFNAVPFGAVVTVTNNNTGPAADAADIDIGAGIVVTTDGAVGIAEVTDVTLPAAAGLDVVGEALRWELSNANDDQRYHVWYNVTDGVNTQVNPVMGNPNGTFTITSIVDALNFTYTSPGVAGTGTGGTCRVERLGMANAGSTAFLSTSRLNTGLFGPIMWDQNASFVLSSLTSNIQQEIKAGNNVRSLEITGVNNIPDEEGFVIFDFGTEFQEGPVRYLFKPTDSSVQMDPAYVFQFNHDIGSAITVIRRKGAHIMSGLGTEYGGYITDPSIAREILQNLILDVKSVGIFVEFLIRFPNQLYSVLDVYKSCRDGFWPLDEIERAKCET